MKTDAGIERRVVLELVPVADPLERTHGPAYRRPAAVRLRAAPKALLRSYGLKCTAVRGGTISQEDCLPDPEGVNRVE